MSTETILLNLLGEINDTLKTDDSAVSKLSAIYRAKVKSEAAYSAHARVMQEKFSKVTDRQ